MSLKQGCVASYSALHYVDRMEKEIVELLRTNSILCRILRIDL